MTDAVLILTTVPDVERGEAIARLLIDEHLAACVNVCAPMTSFYRWRGTVERDHEHQLVIKASRGRVRAIESRIRDVHPYELPEFLVLPVADGSQSYVDWIIEGTRA